MNFLEDTYKVTLILKKSYYISQKLEIHSAMVFAISEHHLANQIFSQITALPRYLSILSQVLPSITVTLSSFTISSRFSPF